MYENPSAADRPSPSGAFNPPKSLGVLAALVGGGMALAPAEALANTEHEEHDHAGHDHTAHEHAGHQHRRGEPGQDEVHSEREAAHSHDHDFEIGLVPGLSYLPAEGEFGFSLHMHLTFKLGDSPWAVGVGAERLFDEHAHNTISAVLEYRLIDEWSVALGPGITFEDDGHPHPALHLETTYALMTGDFHLGPAFEAAIDTHEMHLTLGVHVGIGF